MTLANTTLHELGVVDAATAIADGSLSPVDLLEHYLERIGALDGTLEAWSYLRIEEARAEAAVLAAEARAGKLRGPLHGVPVGIKEQFALAGAPTRTDWRDPNSPIATYDSAAAERFKAAGAIMLGKLYMVGPETPPTRNPWNLEHTPGGSSSGSGAAVGARLIPMAMSEQTGGSGIRPAAYCGVSGLKATFGRISCYGVHPLSWTHDYACIIAYSIPDVARVYSAIAGYDPRDPGSIQEPPPSGEIDYSRPPRIGYVRNFYPDLQEPETNELLEQSADTLRRAGAVVEDALLPEDFELAWISALVISLGEGAAINAGKGDPTRPPPIAPNKKARKVSTKWGRMPQHLGQFVPATYYLHANRVRRHLQEELAPLFEQYDALMMATAPGGAPKGLASSGDQTLLLPWSSLGHPAASISAGLNAEGMPVGIQLVSGLRMEDRLLGAAGWSENVIGRLPVPEFAR